MIEFVGETASGRVDNHSHLDAVVGDGQKEGREIKRSCELAS